jgi:hypothetical protein
VRRWIFFFVVIAIGAAAGMIYGWVINPVEYVDTTPVSLRQDYKTDYVLMVAEAYQAEKHLGTVARRLALLGDATPLEIVNQAVSFASEIGYSDSDLALMKKLAEDLQAWNPSLEVPVP